MNTNAVASDTSKLSWGDTSVELPNVVGSEGERAVDIAKLRGQTGVIALDEGYRNTGSCRSAITFINGEKGTLRYRGLPIEQVAERSSFIETAWLLIFGELPTRGQLDEWTGQLAEHAILGDWVDQVTTGMTGVHPMAAFSAIINITSGHHPDVLAMDDPQVFRKGFQTAAAKLLAKAPMIAAAIHRASVGEKRVQADAKLEYCQNLLHAMFSAPGGSKGKNPGVDAGVDPDMAHALNMILLLHADHEQNCSTSTVRMVASSQANLFASCAAGVCALWGPLHGGANIAVLNQLEEIHQSGVSVTDYIANLKKTKDKLFGFGHAVYKNFDPRARILKNSADKILGNRTAEDPLLDIARELEAAALSDDYFVKRKLYPNVDFYSGVIMRAMGIPQDMFTVMFAVGRMAGWIAHFKEVRDSDGRIYRPRQVYVGPRQRDYVPVEGRG